jgi:hypothetical protein
MFAADSNLNKFKGEKQTHFAVRLDYNGPLTAPNDRLTNACGKLMPSSVPFPDCKAEEIFFFLWNFHCARHPARIAYQQ